MAVLAKMTDKVERVAKAAKVAMAAKARARGRTMEALAVAFQEDQEGFLEVSQEVAMASLHLMVVAVSLLAEFMEVLQAWYAAYPGDTFWL